MQAIRAEFPRAYEPWLEQEEALLCQEYRSGQSIAELSRKLQRTPGGIKSHLRKLAVGQEDPPQPWNGSSSHSAPRPEGRPDTITLSSRADPQLLMAPDFSVEWRPVLRDGVARYLFPEPITAYMRHSYNCPAVYRWVVLEPSSDRPYAIYIGMSKELCPSRLEGYLTPGASETNKRLNEALLRSLSDGYGVHLDIAVVQTSVEHAKMICYDLSAQSRRILIENLLIEHYRRAGMRLLN